MNHITMDHFERAITIYGSEGCEPAAAASVAASGALNCSRSRTKAHVPTLSKTTRDVCLQLVMLGLKSNSGHRRAPSLP